MKKSSAPYPEYKTKQEYLDEAVKYFSDLIGYPVEITANNCAAYLYEALRYRTWLQTCPTCGCKTREIPEALRKGISALYGANMGRMKGM
ncbi:MAG: hypothetical protein GTO63_05740 [Anaerolineae bacterium]|nr:hypothetical protein [Anaerolineae bacterium]NIN94474.1 hypothetical protein [Anaerolineae bacterium]NIQ77543.1 hypothetical protein [Anaerolineae bacterium]